MIISDVNLSKKNPLLDHDNNSMTRKSLISCQNEVGVSCKIRPQVLHHSALGTCDGRREGGTQLHDGKTSANYNVFLINLSK